MYAQNYVSVLSPIESNNPDILAMAINGHLDEKTISEIYGMIAAKLRNQKTLALLIRFDHYDGVDWRRLFSDDTDQIRQDLSKTLTRCALIGCPNWMNLAANLLQRSVAIEIQSFDPNDESAAWDFVQQGSTFNFKNTA